MPVVKFTFDKKLINDFINFGYELYKNDSQWIPPFRHELYYQLTECNPFFKQQGNIHQNFIVYRDNYVTGRVSAIINNKYCNGNDTDMGMLGFFDCINDKSVSSELLSAAIEWLSKKGVKTIIGPMNFDIWNGYRIMTKGFDQSIFMGEPYNKPYYKELLEISGFKTGHTWNSIEISDKEILNKVIAKGKIRYDNLLNKGYRFESFDIKNFEQEIRKLYTILTNSFSKFHYFYEISFDDFFKYYSKAIHALRPGFFNFIYDEKNKLSGFTGMLLDLSEALRVMKGKYNLISKLRFAIKKNRSKRVLFYIAGFTKEEALKKSGLGRAGLYYQTKTVFDQGIYDIIFALMSEENIVQGFFSAFADQYKREYTLYKLEL